MDLKIGYLPFPNDTELVEMATRVVNGHNDSHKADRFRKDMIKAGSKALQGVNFYQQLYIFAHGTEGGDSIMDSTGGSMTMIDLAKQLKAEKLTTSIRKIKLWICEGSAGGMDSSAQIFKNAIVLEGYRSTAVFGYSKLLASGMSDDGKHKYGGDYDFGTETWSNTQTAKKLRSKF
jgi:hypothetical protein